MQRVGEAISFYGPPQPIKKGDGNTGTDDNELRSKRRGLVISERVQEARETERILIDQRRASLPPATTIGGTHEGKNHIPPFGEGAGYAPPQLRCVALLAINVCMNAFVLSCRHTDRQRL